MANNLIQFDTTTVGTIPTGFVSRFSAAGSDTQVVTLSTWETQQTYTLDDSLFGVRVFRIERGATNYLRIGFEYTELAGSTADEIAGVVSVDSGGDTRPSLWFRSSGSATTETGYLVNLWTDNTSKAIQKISSGSASDVGTFDFAGSALVKSQFKFRVRCYADGSNVKVDCYYWNIEASEPATPTVTYTDVSPLSTGWIGVGYQGASGHCAFGHIGIANNGDTAPMLGDTNWGVRITGIKEPNASDSLVTGVTNARVRAWLYGEDGDAPTWPPFTNQTITAGIMEVELPVTDNTETPTIAVDWDAGGGETKFFRATANIIDLDV